MVEEMENKKEEIITVSNLYRFVDEVRVNMLNYLELKIFLQMTSLYYWLRV